MGEKTLMDAVIRNATLEDAAVIAAINIDTWRHAYARLLPRSYLDGLSLEKSVEQQREHLGLSGQLRLVAETSQKIVAYAAVGNNRVPFEGYDCEFYGLYVSVPFQREGVGTALFKKGMEWLWAQGYKKMVVWVLEDNPGRKFYEKNGGVLLETRRRRVFGMKKLFEVAYGWEGPGLSV